MGSLLQDQGKNQDAISLLVPAEPTACNAFTGDNALHPAEFLAPRTASASTCR